MANAFAAYQFLYSYNAMLTFIEGQVSIGASGAVSSITGGGISSVTRLSTGVYKVVFDRPYYRFLGIAGSMEPAMTGSTVNMGSLVTGTTYQIMSLGNSTQAQWVAAGLDANTTAAVNVPFVATAAGAGTGTVMAVGVSAINAVGVVGNPQLTISQQTNPYIIIQTVNDSGALANPENGSVLVLNIMARYSSVKGRGE